MNISEFCKIYTGTGFPMDFQGKKNGKYPFYKVSDISVSNTQQKIFLGNANNYIDELELSILKGNIIPAGTIVFAKIGEALKLNKRAITSCECLIDNNVIGIKPDDNIINLLYFYYYLLKIDMLHYSESTTLPSVRKSTIEQINVKIPPIDVQNKRVTILNICHKIIKNQVKLIHNLDLLVKSRFVELFGDVVLNTLDWPLVKLSAIAEYRIGLTYKPEAVSSSGIAVLRSGNIQNSQLCYEDTIYVNSKVDPKLLLKKNDILMCARNGSQSLVGKVALIENDISNTTYGAFMMAISSKYYVYLFEYFRSQAFRRLISVGSTTTINQVTTRMLNSIVIPLPDQDTINRFALYHSQINKLKSDVQKSIDETQLLMDSLMQEYFG